jgi:hypothetical protein
MPAPHRLLGDPHQLAPPRGTSPTATVTRVAVPAVDDRPAVDRDHVALVEHPGPGMPCTTSSLTESQIDAGKAVP